MASAVPSSAEWSAHDEEPAGFDPAKVWSYTRKVFSDEGVVEGWSCVWCLKKFKGPPNSTKALYHQASISGHEIALCLGAHNGTQPAWFTASLRACIIRKKMAGNAKDQVRR